MTNGFALNHNKSLQIYLFFEKHQAKNDFLKDVESRVGVSWSHDFYLDGLMRLGHSSIL